MVKVEKLSASSEDYLEAIFNIISQKGGVRAKDIAGYLGVKAGSVTTALQALSKSKHVNYKPYDVITLTPKGLGQAKKIIKKHQVLKDFFTEILGADTKVAETGACSIEHVIPDNLLKRLISFTEFIQTCPRCGNDLIEKFHSYFSKKQPFDKEKCRKCIVNGVNSLEKAKNE